MRAISGKLPAAWRALCHEARRDERGIAAVEFALILPLMLMIYLGLVELTRGMRAVQRLDLVSHSLADLTAQILPISKSPTASCTGTSAPCINEDDVNNIFSAAVTLMAPLPANTLKMTISEVEIVVDPPPPATPTGWKAKTMWSVTRNSGQKRECQFLVAETDPPPYSLTKIAASYVQETNGVTPTATASLREFLIISDISYDYAPGVHFEFFKWKSSPTWTIKRTSYASLRNTTIPNHLRYFMTTGTNCNAPTP